MNILAEIEVRASSLLKDELWNGAYHTQRAHDYFLQAHTMREQEVSREHFHRLAIEELDKLAEALGLELVARENVEGCR
jgi:hypothetical protein